MVQLSTASGRRALFLLCAAPAVLALLVVIAPITTDPVALFGGIPYDLKPNWLPGFSTIDPNKGFTSYALGVRAARDLLVGQIPLWNPYEGLGSPLLGEMQAAALFPPTLLLLLPFGQVIEQAFLQIVAGIGTYLFLRRFGLGVTAALAGGLLFEFNGVFAWLRNAIYNPVALLPWLFYVAESLFAAALARQSLRSRGGMIALGAIAASLALYAGFPEVVYFYCLPLFAWVAIRALSLPWRRTLAYLGDLLLLAVAAFLLAAPLLLAFWHFLAEGFVGDHQNDGFKDAIINPGGMVMYLIPYLFGPISFSPNPAIANFWGNGGYLGLTPSILAIGGVLAAWRRPVVWLLASWIVVAVGVSHGAPILLDGFRHLPLVTIAAFARYLNAGWLFCAVTLAALFVDRVPTMLTQQRRQLGMAAIGLGVLLLLGALEITWPVLVAAWHAHQGQRAYIVVSLAAAALLLAGVIASVWRRDPGRAQLALTTLCAVEAIVLFAVPFASNPRGAKLDMALVDFLQRHAGLQRVAIAAGNGLSPNFGSAFGISTINYDDTPVPNRTVAFVQRELDPKVLPIMFRPNVSFRHETPAERRDDFLLRIPGYAQAGVRYVLANADFFATTFALQNSGTRPVPLAAGQSVTLDLHPRPGLTVIRAANILIGTYSRTSDGRLTAQLCQNGRCQVSSADLAAAADNSKLKIEFTPPFELTDGPYRFTVSKLGGDHPVALWSTPPLAAETAHASGVPEVAGVLPNVTFVGGDTLQPILQTRTTAVFELAGARAYASAPFCRVAARSHDRMVAECGQPSRLARLEVFMNGWTARVNGKAAPVAPFEDTFQSIDLPAGRSVIEFVYAPPGVRPALWLAAATLIGLAAMALAARRGRGPRR